MRSLRAFLWIFLGAGSIATAQEGPAFPDATNESDHFWFNLPAGYTVADAATLGEQFDRIFEIVADRVDASLDQKITLVFDYPRPGHCPSRAWTTASRDSLPMIFVLASEDTPAAQIKGALAHEVGHVLDEAAIASRRELAIIREGFATWAAGPYWLEWKGVRSFRSAIASYKAAGMYLPLHENEGFLDTLSEDAAQRFGEDCLYYRDLIYTEWGGVHRVSRRRVRTREVVHPVPYAAADQRGRERGASQFCRRVWPLVTRIGGGVAGADRGWGMKDVLGPDAKRPNPGRRFLNDTAQALAGAMVARAEQRLVGQRTHLVRRSRTWDVPSG